MTMTLVFAASDKGGTGRSVTSCNVVYRRALQGSDVCYLDFDFGSPTSGAIFNIAPVSNGTQDGGLHSYLQAKNGVVNPAQVDIWHEATFGSRHGQPALAGNLVLLPGDYGGGEFSLDDEGLMVQRCVELFLRLEESFDVVVVDLSAGRAAATELVLAATADPRLKHITARWLVYHRWTRQHIIAANSLVYGQDGILDTGSLKGHDRQQLRNSIRFVRTAMIDPYPSAGDADYVTRLPPEQLKWLRTTHQQLKRLAAEKFVGKTLALGTIPLDPVLQWQEQIITETETMTELIANQATLRAFDTIATRLTEARFWTGS